MTETKSKSGRVSMVIGSLILLLSGGCTLFFLGVNFMNDMMTGIWGLALAFGGPPILLGLAILMFGRWRAKRAYGGAEG